MDAAFADSIHSLDALAGQNFHWRIIRRRRKSIAPLRRVDPVGMARVVDVRPVEVDEARATAEFAQGRCAAVLPAHRPDVPRPRSAARVRPIREGMGGDDDRFKH